MERIEIEEEFKDSKVMIVVDKYGHQLRILRSGGQWLSIPITPELAEPMIKALISYQKEAI